MTTNWTKYGEIYVDKKFNHKVVCIACKAIFIDMHSYWEHVQEAHWRNDSDSHKDFQKSSAPVTTNKIIDLTESDDEDSKNDHLKKTFQVTARIPLPIQSQKPVTQAKIASEPVFDELDLQLSLIHGENIPTTQEVKKELQVTTNITRVLANIPTPEASPVENRMDCAFSSTNFVAAPVSSTTTTTAAPAISTPPTSIESANKDQSNNICHAQKQMPLISTTALTSNALNSLGTNFSREDATQNARHRSTTYERNPSFNGIASNNVTVSIPLNQNELPSTSKNSSTTPLTYKEHKEQKLMRQNQQQQKADPTTTNCFSHAIGSMSRRYPPRPTGTEAKDRNDDFSHPISTTTTTTTYSSVHGYTNKRTNTANTTPTAQQQQQHQTASTSMAAESSQPTLQLKQLQRKVSRTPSKSLERRLSIGASTSSAPLQQQNHQQHHHHHQQQQQHHHHQQQQQENFHSTSSLDLPQFLQQFQQIPTISYPMPQHRNDLSFNGAPYALNQQQQQHINDQLSETAQNSRSLHTQALRRRNSYCGQILNCLLCPHKPSFKSDTTYQRHMAKFHNQDGNNETFFCKVCDKRLLNCFYERHQKSQTHCLKQQNCANGTPAPISKRRKTMSFLPY